MFYDPTGHTVVHAPARQHDLRVIAQLLRLVGEVIGVNADAVPSHQPWTKRQKVPLRACRLQYIQRVDPQLAEDDRQLVHQCDVEVALDILDHLGSFCYLQVRSTMSSGCDN